MTIALYSLLFACLMPMIAKVPLAYAMHQSGGYNNKYPREQQAKLRGLGARARAAHENSFEALIVFAPCLLASIALQRVDGYIETCALIFVAARLVYWLMYLVNQHMLRSTAWVLGYGSCIAMLVHLL